MEENAVSIQIIVVGACTMNLLVLGLRFGSMFHASTFALMAIQQSAPLFSHSGTCKSAQHSNLFS